MLLKCIPGWRQIFSLLGLWTNPQADPLTNFPRTSICSSEIPTGTIDKAWNTGLTSGKAIHIAHAKGWYNCKMQRLWHILWRHAETEELLAWLFLDIHLWHGMKDLFFHFPYSSSISSWFLISISSSVESSLCPMAVQTSLFKCL